MIPRLWAGLVCLVALAGAAGQIRVWASDRAFWNDELYIALNVRDRGLIGLTRGLRYVQVAPPGWLMCEKVVFWVLGDGEHALRLPSLIGTLAVLALTAVVAWRSVGWIGAVIATALVAAAPMVLTYAGELKQYAVEAAVALLMLLVAEWYGRDASLRRAAVWSAVGLAAVAVSYSAIIVLAGTGAALGLSLLLARRRRDLYVFLAAAAPPALLGAALVVRRLSFPLLSNQDAFFPTGLPPKGAGPVELMEWLPRMWRGFVVSPLSWAHPWIVLALVVLGLFALVVRGRRRWASLLGGVLVAAVAAAAAHGLPLQDRVALYLVAPVAVSVAAAVDGAGRAAVLTLRSVPRRLAAIRTAPRQVIVAVAGGIGLALVAAGTAVAVRPAVEPARAEVAHPRYRDRGAEVVEDVARRIQPGDAVLLYAFSRPLGEWYGVKDGLPIAGLANLTSPGQCHPGSVAQSLGRARRVWYVHGALLSAHPGDYHHRVVAALTAMGRLEDAKTTAGQDRLGGRPGWALVDLTAGPHPSPESLPPKPRFSCLEVLPFGH